MTYLKTKARMPRKTKLEDDRCRAYVLEEKFLGDMDENSVKKAHYGWLRRNIKTIIIVKLQ